MLLDILIVISAASLTLFQLRSKKAALSDLTPFYDFLQNVGRSALIALVITKLFFLAELYIKSAPRG